MTEYNRGAIIAPNPNPETAVLGNHKAAKGNYLVISTPDSRTNGYNLFLLSGYFISNRRRHYYGDTFYVENDGLWKLIESIKLPTETPVKNLKDLIKVIPDITKYKKYNPKTFFEKPDDKD